LSERLDLSDFEPEFEAWLRRGLSTDIDQRFLDAADMQTAWRQLMQAAEVNAQLAQTPEANGTESGSRASWWKRVIGR